MKAGDLNFHDFAARLSAPGLHVRLGPFTVRIQTDWPRLGSLLHRLYHFYPLADDDNRWTDFHVGIYRALGLRRWWRPQICFRLDGQAPFAPYARDHALPALEWGLNWCIATRSHHLLMLHAAVVERRGFAMLLPAWPGHGKSTLCTALIHSGWRLLSDEFGLINPADGLLQPLPRLIPLKNESIGVIKRFAPVAELGPSFRNTRKGTVAHVRPPEDSIQRGFENAEPRWLVFPQWLAGSPLELRKIARSEAFLLVATNAFNYEILGAEAFHLTNALVKKCDCYSLVYSDLTEAMIALDSLAASA